MGLVEPTVGGAAQQGRPPPSPPSAPPDAKRARQYSHGLSVKAVTSRRPWPPELWEAAARRSGAAIEIVPTLHGTLALCRGSARAWAFDLPSLAGGAPKRYVVATAPDFAAALSSLPAEHRHAYEVVRARPCWAYFDLEREGSESELIEADATAGEVACLAALLLQEQDAAQQQLGRAITVEVAALDSPRDGKFSRHVILRAHTLPGTSDEATLSPTRPLLLSGPGDAAAEVGGGQFPDSRFQIVPTVCMGESEGVKHQLFVLIGCK